VCVCMHVCVSGCGVLVCVHVCVCGRGVVCESMCMLVCVRVRACDSCSAQCAARRASAELELERQQHQRALEGSQVG